MPDLTLCERDKVQLASGTLRADVRGRFYLRVGHDLGQPEFAEIDPRTGFLPFDDEPIWVAGEFREAFRDAGLDRFDTIMHSQRGHCMRSLAIRENWQLSLTVRGRRRTLFLKRHRDRSWLHRVRALCGTPAGRSAGLAEATNIRKLESAGIRCMELAACGERLQVDGTLESFLVTPELEGFVQLDEFLRERFGILDTDRSKPRDTNLGRLLVRVADLAKRLHDAGFNHRDLYCCHFFVREDGAGDFEIRLIDLQRVQHRRRWRRRWLVKDLAQLAYSAPRDRIKCTQKMAFMRRYLGVARLRPGDKRLIREILAKQQAMECKLGRIA